MRVLKSDIEKKVKELKKVFRNIEIHIDGRRRAIYINGVRFSFQEFWELDLNRLKHPSFWRV